jgi:Pentatricopeptide repeat domain
MSRAASNSAVTFNGQALAVKDLLAQQTQGNLVSEDVESLPVSENPCLQDHRLGMQWHHHRKTIVEPMPLVSPERGKNAYSSKMVDVDSNTVIGEPDRRFGPSPSPFLEQQPGSELATPHTSAELPSAPEVSNSPSVDHSQDPSMRPKLIHILAKTKSASEAWEVYCALLAIPRGQQDEKPHIPFLLLHRLCRLLIRTRPRTRALFLRLLSVLKTVHATGGMIHLHEWNALIHCAGNGWRKVRPEDFDLAMGIYTDMISQKAPGTTSSGAEPSSGETRVPKDAVKPDIFTYTTLLAVAIRTDYAPAIQHAISLMKSSGIAPNRITHLSLLRLFTSTKHLAGVYSTLVKMKEQGFHLGVDGINACMWAFGHNDRLDLVHMIYRVLRHHVIAESDGDENDIRATIEYLSSSHGIDIPDNLVPDAITYVTTVQILAFHGHLVPALDVFTDMLSSGLPAVERQLHPNNNDSSRSPLVAIFRALFLAFARHSKYTSQGHVKSVAAPTTSWTIENLDALFQSFLALPGSIRQNRGIIYWILVAFEKTNDVDKLRQVWLQLEERFPPPWAGPDHRLEMFRKRIFGVRVKHGSR